MSDSNEDEEPKSRETPAPIVGQAGRELAAAPLVSSDEEEALVTPPPEAGEVPAAKKAASGPLKDTEIEASLSLRIELQKVEVDRNKEEVRKISADVEVLEQRKHDLISDRTFREVFAPRVFTMVAWWLAGIGAFVFMHGCQDTRPNPQNAHSFSLPTEVLVTMISGVSLAVVGLLATVLVYLFPKRDGGAGEKKET